MEQSSVPCCAESGSAWETSRCDAVEEFSASDAVGAIGDADCGDAMLGEGRGMPPVGSCLLSVKCLGILGKGRGFVPARRVTFSTLLSFERTSSTLIVPVILVD